MKASVTVPTSEANLVDVTILAMEMEEEEIRGTQTVKVGLTRGSV